MIRVACWQNADPDVRKDMETFLSKVAVPEVSGAKIQGSGFRVYDVEKMRITQACIRVRT